MRVILLYTVYNINAFFVIFPLMCEKHFIGGCEAELNCLLYTFDLV